LLAASASAQAGITIPAGDWTVDIGGNVNAFYTNTRFSGDLETATKGAFTDKSANTVQTGLLPSALGIGAKTRQNDLDIAFQFSFFTGADSGGTQSAFNPINVRQAYMTFGDASWGTVKMGRDLGIFASDAILSDMTLLGVGAGAGQGGSSTLGRIGSGYQYADWKGQITYISPNWNGFDFAAGMTQGWTTGTTAANDQTNHNLGFEAKAGYSWTGDVAGKVWASALSQRHEATATADSYTSRGFDIGGKVSTGGLGLVAYYYDGKGLSGAANVSATSANLLLNGFNYNGIGINNKTDDKGGYVQATYVIPTGTKLGVSWGQSKSEADVGRGDFTSRSWIVGAYHPITKSLNLVAEYTDHKLEGTNANSATVAADNLDGKAKTVSLGAILFF